MPAFVDVPDPLAAGADTGQIRYDLRRADTDAAAPTDTDTDAAAPPLVLLGGMTQTVSSWSGQLRPLAQTRTVLAYEARGQGATRLSLDDASLSQHVNDAANLLSALEISGPVDLCGFSFGGRVALAIAAERPDLVRRLVLSGVGRDRTVLSRCIVDGWQAALRTGDLEALARISLSDIVGPDYLEAHANMVEPMIKAVVQRNSYEGITALFRDTMGEHDDAASSDRLAAKVRCPALAIGGAQDRIAPPQEVRALAAAIGATHRIFVGAGHTVPIEAAEPWRRVVLNFLDSATPTADITVSHGTVMPGGDPADDSLGP